MESEKKLRKDEYDIYSISLGKLPFFCSQKKIKQRLRLELEKIHPCFSEQCCFDYVLKREKGCTVARIIVADSLFIAKTLGLSANYLLAPEFGRKKLFLTEKASRLRKMAVWGAVLIVLAAVSAVMLPSLFRKDAETVAVPVAEVVEEQKVYDISVFLSDTLPGLISDDLNISYFEYSSDRGTQIMIHESGVQREVIDASIHVGHDDVSVTYSSTTYQEKIPYLTFTVDCDKQIMKTASFSDVQSCITAIRNAVFASDGLPVSEQYDIRQFHCIIPYKSFEGFLGELEKIQDEQKAKFQKFIFDYDRDLGNINCIITLDQFKCEEPVRMSLLSGIFKAPVEKVAQKPKQTTTVEKKAVDANRTLIGKMPSADGGTLLYYRTSDGKIVYERE